MAALQCENGDRSALQQAFGGDCTRIAKCHSLLARAEKYQAKSDSASKEESSNTNLPGRLARRRKS